MSLSIKILPNSVKLTLIEFVKSLLKDGYKVIGLDPIDLKEQHKNFDF